MGNSYPSSQPERTYNLAISPCHLVSIVNKPARTNSTLAAISVSSNINSLYQQSEDVVQSRYNIGCENNPVLATDKHGQQQGLSEDKTCPEVSASTSAQLRCSPEVIPGTNCYQNGSITTKSNAVQHQQLRIGNEISDYSSDELMNTEEKCHSCNSEHQQSKIEQQRINKEYQEKNNDLQKFNNEHQENNIERQKNNNEQQQKNDKLYNYTKTDNVQQDNNENTNFKFYKLDYRLYEEVSASNSANLTSDELVERGRVLRAPPSEPRGYNQVSSNRQSASTSGTPVSSSGSLNNGSLSANKTVKCISYHTHEERTCENLDHYLPYSSASCIKDDTLCSSKFCNSATGTVGKFGLPHSPMLVGPPLPTVPAGLPHSSMSANLHSTMSSGPPLPTIPAGLPHPSMSADLHSSMSFGLPHQTISAVLPLPTIPTVLPYPTVPGHSKDGCIVGLPHPTLPAGLSHPTMPGQSKDGSIAGLSHQTIPTSLSHPTVPGQSNNSSYVGLLQPTVQHHLPHPTLPICPPPKTLDQVYVINNVGLPQPTVQHGLPHSTILEQNVGKQTSNTSTTSTANNCIISNTSVLQQPNLQRTVSTEMSGRLQEPSTNFINEDRSSKTFGSNSTQKTIITAKTGSYSHPQISHFVASGNFVINFESFGTGIFQTPISREQFNSEASDFAPLDNCLISDKNLEFYDSNFDDDVSSFNQKNGTSKEVVNSSVCMLAESSEDHQGKKFVGMMSSFNQNDNACNKEVNSSGSMFAEINEDHQDRKFGGNIYSFKQNYGLSIEVINCKDDKLAESNDNFKDNFNKNYTTSYSDTQPETSYVHPPGKIREVSYNCEMCEYPGDSSLSKKFGNFNSLCVSCLYDLQSHAGDTNSFLVNPDSGCESQCSQDSWFESSSGPEGLLITEAGLWGFQDSHDSSSSCGHCDHPQNMVESKVSNGSGGLSGMKNDSDSCNSCRNTMESKKGSRCRCLTGMECDADYCNSSQNTMESKKGSRCRSLSGMECDADCCNSSQNTMKSKKGSGSRGLCGMKSVGDCCNCSQNMTESEIGGGCRDLSGMKCDGDCCNSSQNMMDSIKDSRGLSGMKNDGDSCISSQNTMESKKHSRCTGFSIMNCDGYCYTSSQSMMESKMISRRESESNIHVEVEECEIATEKFGVEKKSNVVQIFGKFGQILSNSGSKIIMSQIIAENKFRGTDTEEFRISTKSDSSVEKICSSPTSATSDKLIHSRNKELSTEDRECVLRRQQQQLSDEDTKEVTHSSKVYLKHKSLPNSLPRRNGKNNKDEFGEFMADEENRRDRRTASSVPVVEGAHCIGDSQCSHRNGTKLKGYDGDRERHKQGTEAAQLASKDGGVDVRGVDGRDNDRANGRADHGADNRGNHGADGRDGHVAAGQCRVEKLHSNSFPCDCNNKYKQYFVAYLCCANEDLTHFGIRFHEKIEGWGLRVFIAARDLELTGPKYENMATWLEDRCNGKIIVVLSKNYGKSDECLFLTYFARTLDPDSRLRNIIPVRIDNNMEIPNVLKGLSIIDYKQDEKHGWLKKKLVNAIAA